MIKHFLSTAILLHAFCLMAAASNHLTMLIGTYTEDSPAEGIYVYSFNQSTGRAALISKAEASNPSFLTVNADATRVYAVSEYADGRQGAYAFSFDKRSGKLTRMSFQHCGATATAGHGNGNPGADPCNIMADGDHVVTSNYTGGDISIFALDANGSLKPEQRLFDMRVNGSDRLSHIHCCRLSPDGKYMFADDLGNDCVWRFDVNRHSDGHDGRPYISSPTVAFSTEAGAGPRHLTFSRDGRHAYLINELNGTISVMSYSDGKLTTLQTIQASTTKTTGSADIHISPDGRYLYASHRLTDDGISIFAINRKDGTLTRIGYQHTAAHPRNFAITPNGKYLLVASRDGNVIEVYRRDRTTGALTDTHQGIHVGKPVCIQFVR